MSVFAIAQSSEQLARFRHDFRMLVPLQSPHEWRSNDVLGVWVEPSGPRRPGGLATLGLASDLALPLTLIAELRGVWALCKAAEPFSTRALLVRALIDLTATSRRQASAQFMPVFSEETSMDRVMREYCALTLRFPGRVLPPAVRTRDGGLRTMHVVGENRLSGPLFPDVALTNYEGLA